MYVYVLCAEYVFVVYIVYLGIVIMSHFMSQMSPWES